MIKMKSSFLVLLPLFLPVTEGFGGFRFPKLCSEQECLCQRPKDPWKISYLYTQKYSVHPGCLCLCGSLRGEECAVDGDCVEGFTCVSVRPNSRNGRAKKVCKCPCDDVNNLYCPSPYSLCYMNGAKPICGCQVKFRCSSGILIPKCVVWANGTIHEYRNPCYFVKDSCEYSREDTHWMEFPHSCKLRSPTERRTEEDVDFLLDNILYENEIESRIEYEISDDVFEVLNWDPLTSGNLGIPGLYMRPEPEAEPEFAY